MNRHCNNSNIITVKFNVAQLQKWQGATMSRPFKVGLTYLPISTHSCLYCTLPSIVQKVPKQHIWPHSHVPLVWQCIQSHCLSCSRYMQWHQNWPRQGTSHMETIVYFAPCECAHLQGQFCISTSLLNYINYIRGFVSLSTVIEEIDVAEGLSLAGWAK
jgi:hypothetical protein